MAFTEDSTKHKKVNLNVSSLGEAAHWDASANGTL